MVKNILFVSDITNSFFLNSIMTNLEKNGYECDYVDYDINRIANVHKTFATYFLFVGTGTNTRSEDTLIYLRNLCKEKRRKLFLLGEAQDVKDVLTVIDEPGIILKAFVRPVNVGDVTDGVIRSYEREQATDTRKTILLVDDSGTVLHTMKQWLEPDYKVTMVNSASTGLAYLAKHRPDLILLDYEMPVCDGPTMLGMIRGNVNLADIPVIFLTGHGDRESIEKVLSLKPQGYLLKSLPKEKILENLENYFKGIKN